MDLQSITNFTLCAFCCCQFNLCWLILPGIFTVNWVKNTDGDYLFFNWEHSEQYCKIKTERGREGGRKQGRGKIHMEAGTKENGKTERRRQERTAKREGERRRRRKWLRQRGRECKEGDRLTRRDSEMRVREKGRSWEGKERERRRKGANQEGRKGGGEKEEERVQFSSVTQLCLTLCNPMDHGMPDLPVHHQLLELTQTHLHWVKDAIQPSHPLLSPSSPSLNLSQRQGLFKWISSSHQVAKVLEFQLQHQSFQWTLRTDLF